MPPRIVRGAPKRQRHSDGFGGKPVICASNPPNPLGGFPARRPPSAFGALCPHTVHKAPIPVGRGLRCPGPSARCPPLCSFAPRHRRERPSPAIECYLEEIGRQTVEVDGADERGAKGKGVRR